MTAIHSMRGFARAGVDAIVTDRAYRKAQSPEAALAELRRCAGTQFDPLVVAAFARALERETPASVRPGSTAHPTAPSAAHERRVIAAERA